MLIFAGIIKSRAEPSRAEPSRAEPSRAEPSRAEPSRAEPSRAEPSRAEPSRTYGLTVAPGQPGGAPPAPKLPNGPGAVAPGTGIAAGALLSRFPAPYRGAGSTRPRRPVSRRAGRGASLRG